MRDIEVFAEQTIKNGGTWFTLEESEHFIMIKSQSWNMVKGHMYGDTPVYQVFNKETGKRLFASVSVSTAYEIMMDYEEDKKHDERRV